MPTTILTLIISNIRRNARYCSRVPRFVTGNFAISPPQTSAVFTIGRARRRACYTRALVGFHQRSQKRAPSRSPRSFNPGKRSVSSLIGLAGFAKFPPGNGMTAVDVNADEICGGFLEPRLLIVRETRYFDFVPARKGGTLDDARCSLNWYSDSARDIRADTDPNFDDGSRRFGSQLTSNCESPPVRIIGVPRYVLVAARNAEIPVAEMHEVSQSKYDFVSGRSEICRDRYGRSSYEKWRWNVIPASTFAGFLRQDGADDGGWRRNYPTQARNVRRCPLSP